MRPDSEAAYYSFVMAVKDGMFKLGMSVNEELAYECANAFLRRFGGSSVYIPKIDEYTRARRVEAVKEWLDKGVPTFFLAHHYDLTEQAINNIRRGVCDHYDIDSYQGKLWE